MKIVVVSDTHGYVDGVVELINRLDDIDLVIHLGDYVDDAIDIKHSIDVKIEYIKGNCDVYSKVDALKEKILKIEGYEILLTHGHDYDVKYGLDKLYYRCKELGVDVALFGHSHVWCVENYDDVLFVNPGSPTIPRGGNKASCALLTIGEEIEVKYLQL